MNKVDIPTTYRPCADHLPTTYRPHTDHVPTTYRPLTDHIFRCILPSVWIIFSYWWSHSSGLFCGQSHQLQQKARVTWIPSLIYKVMIILLGTAVNNSARDMQSLVLLLHLQFTVACCFWYCYYCCCYFWCGCCWCCCLLLLLLGLILVLLLLLLPLLFLLLLLSLSLLSIISLVSPFLSLIVFEVIFSSFFFLVKIIPPRALSYLQHQGNKKEI